MILLYSYFIINAILTGKILYNLNTKLKDDTEAWSDAKLFIPITLLFGVVLFVKAWMQERNS